MKKIPSKFRMVVFVFLMTLFIGFILSGILLLQKEGFIDDFFQVWMKNFITTWLTVIPVVIVVVPIVNKVTDRLVEKEIN